MNALIFKRLGVKTACKKDPRGASFCSVQGAILLPPAHARVKLARRSGGWPHANQHLFVYPLVFPEDNGHLTVIEAFEVEAISLANGRP